MTQTLPSHMPQTFRATFRLTLLVFLLALAGSVKAQCTLKAADLPAVPELRGFHLGMTTVQAKARLPQIVFGKVDALGVSKTTINPGFDQHIDQQAFADVRSISLDFLDERISSVWIGYEASFKWHTVDEFVAGVSKSLDLPAAWESWRARGSRLRCADFEMTVTTVAGGPAFHLTDKTAERTVAERRAVQAEQREAPEEVEAEVVGDKRNRVYYLERCLVAHPLTEKDRVSFKTKEDAEKAGYKPATNCE